MTNSVSIQPMITGNAAGLFSKTTAGLVVGDYFPDPGTRWALTAGTLHDKDDLPMWGGVALSVGISSDEQSTGGKVNRAETIDKLNGFSVNSNNAINSTGSDVPLIAANMQVNFFKIGSRQRIILAVDPSIAGALALNSIGQGFDWDFDKQWIKTGSGLSALGIRILSLTTNAKIPVFDKDKGTASWVVGTAAVIQL